MLVDLKTHLNYPDVKKNDTSQRLLFTKSEGKNQVEVTTQFRKHICNNYIYHNGICNV